MAQKVEIVLTCDTHIAGEEQEDVETVRFSLDGTEYEIELCADHVHRLRAALHPFIEHGRMMRTRGKAARPAAVRQRPADEKARNQDIREWAAGKGYAVSPRGRIPGPIVEEYDLVH